VTIRALIVDDEPLGRERIRTLLGAHGDVEIVGECPNGKSAVTAVARLKPDLMFLDVQMPEMDGFAVVEAIADKHLPAIIFVTAYDRYALKAFEVHALDYLLKSFDPDRFHHAVERARGEIARAREGALSERLAGLVEDLESRKRCLTRVVIKSAGRIFFLSVDEIDWIEAADNYARIHSGRDTHLVRETLQALEARLNPEQFLRIHRSTIVNVSRIRELQPLFHGDYSVRLKDGTELTLSRNYREKLTEPLGQFL